MCERQNVVVKSTSPKNILQLNERLVSCLKLSEQQNNNIARVDMVHGTRHGYGGYYELNPYSTSGSLVKYSSCTCTVHVINKNGVTSSHVNNNIIFFF